MSLIYGEPRREDSSPFAPDRLTRAELDALIAEHRTAPQWLSWALLTCLVAWSALIGWVCFRVGWKIAVLTLSR